MKTRKTNLTLRDSSTKNISGGKIALTLTGYTSGDKYHEVTFSMHAWKLRMIMREVRSAWVEQRKIRLDEIARMDATFNCPVV